MFNVVFHLAHTWIVIIGFRERLHLMHAQTGHRHINGVSSAWDFRLRNRTKNTPISAKSLVRFASSSVFSRLIHSGKNCVSFKMLRFFLGVWFGWAEPPEFRLFVFIFFAVFFSVHSVLSVELMCSYHGAIEFSERETVPVHDLFLFVHTHNALTHFHCTNLIQSLSLSFPSPTFCNGSLTAQQFKYILLLSYISSYLFALITKCRLWNAYAQ